MGLDMYLYLSKTQTKIGTLPPNFYPMELTEFGQEMALRSVPAKTEDYLVMYWCGAWEIHEWLLDNTGCSGEGCNYTYVDIETMRELLEECKNNPDWTEVEYTIENLTKLINLVENDPEWEFRYSASR